MYDMEKWLKRKLRYTFSGKKWYRKWVGGYWEKWYLDCIHGDIWFDIDKKTAYEGITHGEFRYRPGCGFGTPYCEYYPLDFFDSKLHLNKDEIKRLERVQKLKRITEDGTLAHNIRRPK